MTPCAHCGKPSKQSVSQINRANRKGVPIYCDRVCAGLARRKYLSDERKKENKASYDAARRIALQAKIREQKAKHHKDTYDPVKAAEYRKKRMPYHVLYCRRPEYKAKKHLYDRRYNLERSYGPLWEIARVLIDLEGEIRSRASHYEISVQNDTVNKTQKRKRLCAQTINDQSRPGIALSHREVDSDKSKRGAVGNAQGHP